MGYVFKSKWITAREFENGAREIKNFYMNVKKDFVIKNAETAYVNITADDYYKLYVNGKFVGQGPAPSYSFSYNYNRFDITPFIKEGKNTVSALVYYQGLINRAFVSGDGRQGLIADIFIDGDYAFGTDETWRYGKDGSFIGTRTYGYDTAFAEDRDMRSRDADLIPCAVKKHDYIFCEKPFPAVEIYLVSVEPTVSKNRYFYDFGREYAGNLRVTAVSERDGAKIIIRCAEELDESGLRYNLRCGCDYEETCILKKGENIIEQYDYKGMRYTEISAESGVSVKSAQLLARHYPFPEISAKIKTDDENLKAVFELCKHTVLYGAQEALIDCPTREKGQYLGDAFISGFSHLILTKDDRLLKKALENAVQSLKFSGEFLAVSPCSLKQKIADYALLFPLMCLRYYEYTEDAAFLEKMLCACEYINRYFKKFADGDGLLNTVNEQWNLVDWPENCRDGYDFDLSNPICEGRHNAVNAYYICALDSTEKIKDILGVPYKSRSAELKTAFNRAFLNSATGLYTDSEKTEHSSVHSNMLALAFGICPKESVKKTADYLVERGMRCSVFASYFYLKALCEAGRYGDAYKAIVSKGKNSWLNMISEGATTCFEAWSKEQKHNTSLFHPWAASPIIILFEELRGKADFEIYY